MKFGFALLGMNRGVETLEGLNREVFRVGRRSICWKCWGGGDV